MHTTNPSAYDLFQREDAAHFGLDGFTKPVSRQLRDHLATGGSMSARLDELRGDRDVRASGMWTAAFLECLIPSKGDDRLADERGETWSPIRRGVVTAQSLAQQLRGLVAEAKASERRAA